MTLQTFRAKVSDYKQWSPRYQSLRLELVEPHRIEFTAGQYIMLKVSGLVGVRQYSITSAPSMDHGIELLADVVPGGKGSMYLAGLKPGDTVEFMAPAGAFSVKDEEQLLFVATGSGIAPVRSMILDLLVDKQDKRQMWLQWGMRYPEDIFWFDNFARMAEEYENFSFDVVLSKPPENWELCSGRVTDCLQRHYVEEEGPDIGQERTLNFAKIGVYVCGSKQMIDDVKGWLTKQGVATERIHHERFY